MDIAVHRVNSVDGNYGMALKYHTYTVYTGYRFFPENLQLGNQFDVQFCTKCAVGSKWILFGCKSDLYS